MEWTDASEDLRDGACLRQVLVRPRWKVHGSLPDLELLVAAAIEHIPDLLGADTRMPEDGIPNPADPLPRHLADHGGNLDGSAVEAKVDPRSHLGRLGGSGEVAGQPAESSSGIVTTS